MAHGGASQTIETRVAMQDQTLLDIKEKQRLELSARRKQQVFEKLSVKRRWVQHTEPQTTPVTKEQLQVLSNKLKRSKDVAVLQQLNKALSDGSQKTIDAFLSLDGALFVLVGCLTSKDEDLQAEAAACIVNLATGKHSSTIRVIKAAAPYLIVYLDSGNVALKDLSAWALGNMAVDCEKCCQMLQVQGFPPAICKLLEQYVEHIQRSGETFIRVVSSHESVVASACFALACYTLASNADSCAEMVTTKTLSFFAQHLQVAGTSNLVASEIANIIFHLTCRCQCHTDLLRSGLVALVITKLAVMADAEPDNLTILTPLTRALGNVAAGENVGELVSHPDLATLVLLLLRSRYNHLKKETLWFLANLIAGGQDGVSFACQFPGLLQQVIQMVDVVGEIGTQALICLCNLSIHPTSCDAIISQNPYLQIEHVLKWPDPHSLILVITVLLHLFRNSPPQSHVGIEGCLQALYTLQYHSSPQVSEMAAHLLNGVGPMQ